tara:strand:+ start:1355 stop:2650 length:1296 start_codon:yes stop_codon:yes gene_type:complete
MGGGLMQLVAYGAQDIYLTGNPQITFFKVVYRRHTNFSMEAILQTFNGSISTGSSSVTATISRNGDLVSNLWLDVKLRSTGLTGGSGTYMNWTNNTGHAFVKECEIEIGGQRIDRHYSQWLDVWNELTDHEESEWVGLNKHAAKNAYLKSQSTVSAAGATMDNKQLYIPLKFWFCRNPGLALPLIALQYHEVKVKLTTRAIDSLVNASDSIDNPATTAPTVNLWADYIYLDTDERRRFAQVSHEYLIEQLQRETGTAPTSQKLNFNHPVKELIWVFQHDSAAAEQTTATVDATLNIDGTVTEEGNDYFCYANAHSDNQEVINGSSQNEGFGEMKLQLNGHDRFAARTASYFRTCQPIQAGHKVPSKHIYCYSFALKPEEHQPSGTCNFSRIDNAKMLFENSVTTNTTLTVYAVNYNVLRIMSGMGGLAYSN